VESQSEYKQGLRFLKEYLEDKKMANKNKDLAYYENLVNEVKDTAKEMWVLIKQSYNLVVQIVNLVGQLIPIGRKLFIKVKEIKAKL